MEGKIQDEISCLEYDFEKPALLLYIQMFGFWMQSRENSRLFPYRSGQTIASSAQPHYTSNKKLTIAGWRIINHLSRYSVATNMWQSHVRMSDGGCHQKPPSRLNWTPWFLRFADYQTWSIVMGRWRCLDGAKFAMVNRIDIFF